MARTAVPTRRFDRWEFALLCAIFLGLAFLWNTRWVYPLKLFVVLLHETSHGLAALATGGSVEKIQVFAQEGGCTETRGGWPFVVVSAGYLGSMLFGAALLLVSTRTKLSQWFVLLLGVGAVAEALRLMPAGSDGRVFAIACGIVLAALAPFPRFVSELALRVIGVNSCLYAILDIKSDVLDRRECASDATQLEKMTRIPAVAWGALWIAVSVVVTFYAAKWAVTGGKPAKVQSEE